MRGASVPGLSNWLCVHWAVSHHARLCIHISSFHENTSHIDSGAPRWPHFNLIATKIMPPKTSALEVRGAKTAPGPFRRDYNSSITLGDIPILGRLLVSLRWGQLSNDFLLPFLSPSLSWSRLTLFWLWRDNQENPGSNKWKEPLPGYLIVLEK